MISWHAVEMTHNAGISRPAKQYVVIPNIHIISSRCIQKTEPGCSVHKKSKSQTTGTVMITYVQRVQCIKLMKLFSLAMLIMSVLVNVASVTPCSPHYVVMVIYSTMQRMNLMLFVWQSAICYRNTMSLD